MNHSDSDVQQCFAHWHSQYGFCFICVAPIKTKIADKNLYATLFIGVARTANTLESMNVFIIDVIECDKVRTEYTIHKHSFDEFSLSSETNGQDNKYKIETSTHDTIRCPYTGRSIPRRYIGLRKWVRSAHLMQLRFQFFFYLFSQTECATHSFIYNFYSLCAPLVVAFASNERYKHTSGTRVITILYIHLSCTRNFAYLAHFSYNPNDVNDIKHK